MHIFCEILGDLKNKKTGHLVPPIQARALRSGTFTPVGKNTLNQGCGSGNF